MNPRTMFSSSKSQQPRLTRRRSTHSVTFASLDNSARPPAGEGSWRSVLGTESRLPNVFWGALSPASLRRMSYYTALQPAEQLVLEGEATYRYVRQDTALWSALHGGRLTTSRLKDALGLRDHTASRIVGGPQYPELGVLQAYTHLLQPPCTPPPSARGSTGAQRSESEALQLNEEARLQYNEAMITAVEGESARPLEERFLATGTKAEARSLASRPAGGVRGHSRNAAEGGSAAADEEQGWSRADRRRISELAALAVGAAGAVRMRLLWGTLQEAAAVATLATLYPNSQLEEVGLLCLSDPRPWGVEPHELPPIGASPDALITHNILITRRDVEAARDDLMQSTAVVHSQKGILDQLGSGTMREAARRVARTVLRAALVRHTQPALSTSATGTIIPAAASSTNSVSSSSGGTLGGATGFSPSTTASVSYHISTSYSNTTGTPSSSDSIIRASVPCVRPSRNPPPPLFACGWEAALDWLAAELLRPYGVGTDGHMAGPSSCQARGSEGFDDTVVAVVQVREVVEVKNHCPFVYKGQRKARKRGLVVDYVVRDRGPIASVWPLWAPQLQAHMACSGVDSALLLSRSPSRGVRLFRMFRDDAYIEAAFDILRELQCGHVACRQPPGCDPWVGRAGYEDFVQRTVALSCVAETLIATSATPKLPGTDQAAFWEMR